MSMQQRPIDGPRGFYCPERDIAHCFPNFVIRAAELMGDGAWPTLKKYMADHEVMNTEMAVLLEASFLYSFEAKELYTDNLEDCLRRCQFYTVSPEARLAYCAILGSMFLAEYFPAIRSAMGETNITPTEMEQQLRNAMQSLLSPSPPRAQTLYERLSARWAYLRSYVTTYLRSTFNGSTPTDQVDPVPPHERAGSPPDQTSAGD